MLHPCDTGNNDGKRSAQVVAMEKLTLLSDQLRAEKEDQQIFKLHEHLRKPDYLDALQNFASPLCPTQVLGSILIDRCDIKSSKKRPLFLTWRNQEQGSPAAGAGTAEPRGWALDYQIIFKRGDDLRQDMLTLQVGALWQGLFEEIYFSNL